MTQVNDIKALLDDNRNEEAIAAATAFLAQSNTTPHDRATALYLRGNAHRRLGDWRLAQNSYLEAMGLEPDGHAAVAYNHLQEILAFYNKDMYNP